MDKSTPTGSGQIFYQLEGTAARNLPYAASQKLSHTAIVLLHGFAEDATVWQHQTDALKDEFPLLLIPHLPGSGPSPLPGSLSMEGMARAIKDILDAEGIEKAVLIGHSMGGYVSLAFAELFPERLTAIGLFHSTAYPDSEEKKEGRRKSIEFIRRNGAAPFIRQSVPNLFAEQSRKDHPEWVESLIARYSHFNPATLIAAYEAMILRPDRTHILRAFSGPVLFILGEKDTAVPLESGLQQSYMPDLSYIHVLPGAAHMGLWEDSQQSNLYLKEFLYNQFYEQE